MNSDSFKCFKTETFEKDIFGENIFAPILGEENFILFFTFASFRSSVNKLSVYFDVK